MLGELVLERGAVALELVVSAVEGDRLGRGVSPLGEHPLHARRDGANEPRRRAPAELGFGFEQGGAAAAEALAGGAPLEVGR
jgi:hypothetical protein